MAERAAARARAHGAGTFQLVDSLHALKADVFAGRINPGSITIVRSIVTPPLAAQGTSDTAVFTGPLANYTITTVGPW